MGVLLSSSKGFHAAKLATPALNRIKLVKSTSFSENMRLKLVKDQQLQNSKQVFANLASICKIGEDVNNTRT